MVKTHQVVNHLEATWYTCNVYVWILYHKTEENLDKFIECSLHWSEFGTLKDGHLSSEPRLRLSHSTLHCGNPWPFKVFEARVGPGQDDELWSTP
jgi:hypothetical protein